MQSYLNIIKDKYDITPESMSQRTPLHESISGLAGITLIVGSSGSGKTTVLRREFAGTPPLMDENKSIIECFDSPEVAEKLLIAFGLRSIPAWFRTINQVSNGERHRAECAFYVSKGFAFIDEFTSVIDRDTAKSLAFALRKYVDNHDINRLVLASCHRDIIEWLQPDHTLDMDAVKLTSRGSLRQRPQINLRIEASTNEDWIYFKKHHYLDSKISKSCHFHTAYIDRKPVAFLAVMHRCGRDIRSYWGESRLVVIPEFQGLGIGFALSEAVGEEYISRGLRYFSKTAHPALGTKRNGSNKWRATSTNMQKRRSYLTKEGKARKQAGFGKTEEAIYRDAKRVCYSHEYMGDLACTKQ